MNPPKCLQLKQRTSFISMIILTTTFFLVEIVVGYATNSMALVADSFHMLSDVVSLFVGFVALRYSKGGKQTSRYTFGWARAEVLGALVNAVFLVALCFSILVEALKRIVTPEHIENPKLVLITGGTGLLVNIIGLFLFHQHGHSHGGHTHSDGDNSRHSHGGKDDDGNERKQCSKAKSKGSTKKHNHKHKHDGNRTKATDPLVADDDVDGTEEQSIVPENEKDRTNNSLVPLICNETTTNVSETKIEDNEITEVNALLCEVKTSMGGQPLLEINPKKNDQDRSKKVTPKSSSQLNIRGVYLHVLGDALGSIIVMVSALIILYAKGKWTDYVDPGMSIMLVLIILKTSIPLLKESSMILMQTVPTHLKIQEMQDRLIDQVPGVVSVHEFHIWQLAGSKIIASAHVQCRTLADYMAIANQLKEFFHNEGIHSTTIQPEFIEEPHLKDSADSEILKDCILECAPNCADGMCCINNPSDTKDNKASETKGSSGRINSSKETKVTIETKELQDVTQSPVIT